MGPHPARRARLALVVTLALVGAGCSGGDGADPAPTADLRFVEAALPAEGSAGHPYGVYAKLVADAPKWNVTVVLAFAPLGEGEEPADVDLAQVPPGARVWSAVVDRMDAGIPVALHEEVALPAGLEAGRYAAILQLEAVDFTAADDLLQGEEAEHRANNTFVSATPVVVTRPTLPDVEFARLSPVQYDVALQGEAEDAEAALLAVNVELVARTHPVEGPLELGFELGIPDAGGETQWFPLQVAGPDGEGGDTGPQDRYGLAPSEQALEDGTPVTATLVPNRARGLHLELYAPTETRAALAALGDATDCELRAHADPAGLLTEHDEEDNRSAVWVRAYPPDPALDLMADVFGDDAGGLEPGGDGLTASARPMTRAAGVDLENRLDRQSNSWSAGNSDFAAGYAFSTLASYGTADRTPIRSGDRVALYDWQGRAVSRESAATAPAAFRLEAAAGGGFRMFTDNPGSPRYPLVMTACGGSAWMMTEPYPIVPTLARQESRPACTVFQFVDADGGVLEHGDHVRWVAPTGALVSPGRERYVATPGTPADAASLFSIRRIGGPSATARSLRLVARGSTDVTVFGKDFTPIALTSTASLDLDAPSDDRFLLAVDVFDVTMLDVDPIVAFEEGGVVTLYSAEKALYSREKSASRKFLLLGFIPLEVTASAKGTLGVVGEVTAGPDRRLTLGVGPYVDLVGAANAEVNIVVADAGVHMDLRFVKLTEVFQGALVLTEAGGGRFELGGELRLESLDGSIYVYADTIVGCGWTGLEGCHPQVHLIDWDGISKTYAWPQTVGRDL